MQPTVQISVLYFDGTSTRRYTWHSGDSTSGLDHLILRLQEFRATAGDQLTTAMASQPPIPIHVP